MPVFFSSGFFFVPIPPNDPKLFTKLFFGVIKALRDCCADFF
jgi:hypothetical protein